MRLVGDQPNRKPIVFDYLTTDRIGIAKHSDQDFGNFVWHRTNYRTWCSGLFKAQRKSACDHKHPADLDMVKIHSLWGSPIARRYFDNLA